MRRLQWAYLLASLGLLWWLLGWTERRHGSDWMAQAALSILYLAAVVLLVAVLVPKATLVRAVRGTSRLVKLGLVLNYFTLLLVLQNVIAAWWTRAAMLAGVFVATWAALVVVWHFFWPTYLTTANTLMGTDEAPFDPSHPQGRTFRAD